MITDILRLKWFVLFLQVIVLAVICLGTAKSMRTCNVITISNAAKTGQREAWKQFVSHLIAITDDPKEIGSGVKWGNAHNYLYQVERK